MAEKEQVVQKIQISKKTLDLLSGKARYRVAYGGRASGKSYEIHLMALLKAMQNPMTILCTRETMISIKDSVHATLVRLIDDYKLPGFQVTEHKISHQNGSKFIFAGLRLTGVRKLGPVECRDFPLKLTLGESRNEEDAFYRRADCESVTGSGNGWQEGSRPAA